MLFFILDGQENKISNPSRLPPDADAALHHEAIGRHQPSVRPPGFQYGKILAPNRQPERPPIQATKYFSPPISDF